MGHEVSSVDPWSGLEQYRRSFFWKGVRRILGSVREADRAKHVRVLRERTAAEKPDIIIVLKGLLLGAGDVENLKEIAPWVVNINHDDFFSANPNNWSALQRGAIPAYDYVFCTREINVTEVLSLNAKAEFFPFAYYPRIHRIETRAGGSQDIKGHDVVFVGTWEKNRAELLENLVQAVEANYAVYGSQWSKLSRGSPLRPFVHDRELIGEGMARILGGSKIALGFLRKENRDDYTQRTFEIPACGGVLLAERTRRHLEWLEEGTEAEFFDSSDPAELTHKVRQLLGDSERRERIRRQGTARVLSGNHTYQDRLERLLELSVSGQRRRR